MESRPANPPPLPGSQVIPRRRETMIALRACHQAVRIAGEVLYGEKLDAPPPAIPPIPTIPMPEGRYFRASRRLPLWVRIALGVLFAILLIEFLFLTFHA